MGKTASLANIGTIADSSLGFRNRIINGAMVIDQRNAGGVLNNLITGQFSVDRWGFDGGQAGKFSVRQNAGSITPPAGFVNYLGVTSLSAYTPTGNDTFQVAQIIEGYNVADLAWGTAAASPATLSFWVYSSLTGTFGGSIATTKTAVWVMPFTYTVSVANTWTYVTVPITAPTATGGANTGNTAGVYVRFGLGAAGTASGGTAGVWTNASNYLQPSGTVNVVGTNGATFYITGVQLEKGSTATSFDYRPYGTELALCQRYYQKVTVDGVNGTFTTGGFSSSTTAFAALTTFCVPMRTAPTALEQSGTASDYLIRQGSGTFACSVVPAFSTITTRFIALSVATVASGLTVGQSGILCANGVTTGYLGWSAEL